jgi:hypothetical protein
MPLPSLSVRVRRILLAALIAAGLIVTAAILLPPADRAEASHRAGEHVGVLSNFRVNATNGYSNLPEFSGQGDGVIGAQCSGAAPLGGDRIPAMVVTNLRYDLTYLRVLNAKGQPLSGEVVINCTVYTRGAGAGTTAAKLEQYAAAHKAR